MAGRAASKIWPKLPITVLLMPGLLLGALVYPLERARASSWRFASHGDYERVVIQLPATATYSASMEADGSYVVKSEAFVGLPASPLAGKRIVHLAGAGKTISMKLAPDTQPKVWRMGDRLVVDVYAVTKVNKAEATNSQLSSNNQLNSAIAKAPAAIVHLPPPKLPDSIATSSKAGVDASKTREKATPSKKTTSVPIAATLESPASVELHSATNEFPLGYFVVPAAAEVGAAAFQRGDTEQVFLDSIVPLDLSSLKDDPAYGGTSLHVLQGGTQIQVHTDAALALRVIRRAQGWMVGFGKMIPGRVPIAGSESHGRILLAAAAPSAVVVSEDPQTGARLLVGTMRVDGAYVEAGLQTPEYTMAPTSLGVVVSPSTDRIDLKSVAKGFEIAEWSGAPLATSAPQSIEVSSTAAASMTRRFDFPDLPFSMLRIRLHGALRDAALAPKAARTDARLRVAQAMLALGMDVEAQAVLSAAAADDPAFDQTSSNAQLRSIAAWLSGRHSPMPAAPGPQAGDHAQRDDEGLFWDTLLNISAPASGKSAALLAATWPVAFNYPQPLRSRILPRLAEALWQSGEKEALTGLLKATPAGELVYARAHAASADGQTDVALALFDQVAESSRRDDAARARRAAVELRLAAKKIDAKTAAGALSDQLYAWRGDDRELDLRLRLATLLAQTGAWRPALTMLRETDQLFPAAHASIHDAETGLVATLVQGDAAAKMAPLELASLVGECADLLGENADSSVLAPVLVDKLLALDLPARAEPILVRLLRSTSGATPKAELGLRLAGLRLARDDAAGAATALNDTQSPGLPADLDGRRLLLKARIRAAVGDNEGALQLLAGLKTAEGFEQTATLLEQGKDWKQASAALGRLVLLQIPATGSITEGQADVLLRLASDEAQAEDAAGLHDLRTSFSSRLKAGTQANLLQVLTQSPVEAVGDLGRASRELNAARQLPSTLGALPSP